MGAPPQKIFKITDRPGTVQQDINCLKEVGRIATYTWAAAEFLLLSLKAEMEVKS